MSMGSENVIVGVDFGSDDRTVVVLAQTRADGGWTLLDLVEMVPRKPRHETIVTPLLTYQPRT